MDILRSLMACKNISEDGSGILDDTAMKTEGYLPQDLNLLLDRAIHASVVHSRGNSTNQGKLHSVKSHLFMNVWSMLV